MSIAGLFIIAPNRKEPKAWSNRMAAMGSTHTVVYYSGTQTMGCIESTRKHTALQTAWVKLPDITLGVKEA